MSIHQQRQEFYKRYDAAVAQLPAELRARVEMTYTEIDPHTGVMMLVDKRARPLATVDELNGSVVLVKAEAAKEPAPKKPAVRYVTEAALNRAITKVAKAVGQLIGETEDAVLKVTESLDARIKSVEASRITKALDAEAIDAMAEMAERLDHLESTLQEIADGGFRYRGYWRQGMQAKRGDAFTHDGSLWWAVRATSDHPCNESADWQVAARKGRDAR
ncbi:MAG: hypothetical protein IAE66_06285 [Xanthomonadaceae bacterium]|nr:hypothetical protein [Xanthomonadaceae bacterium]